MSEKSFLTYRFRIKGGSSKRRLSLLSPAVNMVWNYCNATSYKAVRDRSEWLSAYDLWPLLKGVSKEIGINSQTVQAISSEFVTRRVQFKKKKLRWRTSKGAKKSLGWIPFNGQTIKVENNSIRYNGQEYKFWKSREFPSNVKCGNFSEDASGNWYVNFVVEVKVEQANHLVKEVGLDLGLKDLAVLSDAVKIENPRIYAKYEEKLANFQRHGKKKQARKLSAKIKNTRKDFIHKKTLELVKKYKTIFVGDVSGNFLQKTNGKSSQDASTGMFRQILSYKAVRHQGVVVDVSEFASTITCSECFEKSGPSGLSDLGVREWECSFCKAFHDRDVNAAKNILRVGRDSLRAALAV